MSSLRGSVSVVNSPRGEQLVGKLDQKARNGQAYPLYRLMADIRTAKKGEKVQVLKTALHKNIGWEHGDQRRALRIIGNMSRVAV
jgi:hypothetical protein